MRILGIDPGLQNTDWGIVEAGLSWRPHVTASPSDDQAETLMKLIDALEDNDDVQQVFANFELTDAQAEKLAI